ncbi:hypothetical protein HOT82_gp001 [Gordonia phage Ronaldo]|uniref:Uncharacterized protein n=4 Tax=Ronaldovirus TaxID=2733205 RepID=A0A6B9LED0_9CAUD|nr:hypothetical protein HOT81_gp001 [Gordonia phage Fryberger]YP_009807697.1 hypothetical protein HOT82_gp001 [Gordonia phage Ronaldo]QDH48488.1 hypothetical protein SEA_ZIKO_2 [Gordonia phage Ziko]QHB38121.1 hypothetical protein SEA_VOLT_1 [Gordonia phage Volt]AXN53421.1 hypothetical protein SEA_FRYBERGER_1 [Gordonia phage Fryberger]AXN53565.1 hypothetical protein SEA_RONALDO_1 [Gordonia phage Ronaldo]
MKCKNCGFEIQYGWQSVHFNDKQGGVISHEEFCSRACVGMYYYRNYACCLNLPVGKHNSECENHESV